MNEKIGKRRIKKLLGEIKKENLDSFLLSNPTNISYLSGFRIAEGYLLVTFAGLVYFTNFIYGKEAKEVKGWEVVVNNSNIFETISNYIKKLGLRRVGFEATHLPFLEYEKFKETLEEKGVRLIRAIHLIEKIRAVKEKKEIDLIKKAVEISEEAFSFVEEIIEKSMEEKDLSIEIERFLRLKGDNEIAFPPIVAFGENSAIVHHRPQKVPLGRTKFFLVDLGAKYKGYCADLTEMFFLGRMPTYIKKVYDIVRKAKDLSLKKVKAGVKAKEVDKEGRQFIENKGFGKYFGHGIGHGVGISVHEHPFINPKNEQRLEEDMVITLEPAIYLPRRAGVRLEDMVLVKANKGEVLNGNVHI